MCKKQSNNKKTDGTRTFFLSRATFIICFILSACLIVAGFLVPPTGIIDGSVLTAVGELMLFPSILYAFRAFELGVNIKLQKGDTTIEIGEGGSEDDHL